MSGHPCGVDAAIARLCSAAWEARLDPAVIIWAHDVARLPRRYPRAVRVEADALLAAFLAHMNYSPAPCAEQVVPAADVVAGSRADADDIAVAFAAAAMSIGLECALVAEDHGRGFTHVTVAIKDVGSGKPASCTETAAPRWLRYDPLYGDLEPRATLRRECGPVPQKGRP